MPVIMMLMLPVVVDVKDVFIDFDYASSCHADSHIYAAIHTLLLFFTAFAFSLDVERHACHTSGTHIVKEQCRR